MATRTVLADRITLHERDDKGNLSVVGHATKGEVVELDDEEAARLDALGATTDDEAQAVAIPEGTSGSGLADALGGAVPNPPEETAKAAGLVDRSDEELPETSQLDAGTVTEVGKVAGLAGFLPTSTPVHEPADGGEPVELATDDELRAMKANELVAYLNQHNDDVDRVEVIEAERGDDARVSVTKAIAAIRSGGNGESTPPDEE